MVAANENDKSFSVNYHFEADCRVLLCSAMTRMNITCSVCFLLQKKISSNLKQSSSWRSRRS